MALQTEELATTDASRVWIPELVQRIAQALPVNVVACTLRLVDKATAAQFSGPRHTTIHLSQLVPAHAFAHHWRSPENLRRLTVAQRLELLCLTARSSSVANLEGLDADYFRPFQKAVFAAAAAAGHLDVCTWLLQHGCPWPDNVLEAAAGSGHQHVCEWLIANGCPRSVGAPSAAALAGHVSLMEWLLQQRPVDVDVSSLTMAAAKGCGLPTLQRLCAERMMSASHGGLPSWEVGPTLDYAVSSPTPDWRAKVEWLQDRGFDWEDYSMQFTMQRPDWRDRIAWLLQKGYPVERLNGLAFEAAGTGDTAALQHLFDLGLTLSSSHAVEALSRALRGGHISAAELIHPHANDFDGGDLAVAIAQSGCVPAMAWLLERVGSAAVLSADVFRWAPRSGSVELLAWLRERGCPWDARAFTTAASAGSEEALEWLAERGCPMEDNGEPYVRAGSNGDLPTLRCLRRLGCAWQPGIDAFTRVVRIMAFDSLPCSLPALRWLLEQGCDVNWDAASAAAQYWNGLRSDLQAAVQQLRCEFDGSAR